jgi:hypothetical protein
MQGFSLTFFSLSLLLLLPQALYLRYLGKILDKMVLLVDAASSWKKNDPSRILFDSLCRRGGAVRHCDGLIMTAFARQTNGGRRGVITL